MTKCNKCDKEHALTIENCCWIYCNCGATICGRCGKSNIEHDSSTTPNDGDDQYWCCQRCADCGLQGCGMCV